MDKLLEYLNSLEPEQRDSFVTACETSENYLRKACSIKQRLNPELCVAIEQNSRGAVTRRDLRPDDWHRIWPELVTARTRKVAA